jgi:hypothetical protein
MNGFGLCLWRLSRFEQAAWRLVDRGPGHVQLARHDKRQNFHADFQGAGSEEGRFAEGRIIGD